jgi:hypothetical protein
MSDSVLPAGPIAGPHSVTVGATDSDGSRVAVQVRPDANNEALKTSGRPTRYYVQPGRVRLARRVDSADYDFSMTAFVKDASSTHVEYIGGTCTFAATLTADDEVLADVIHALTAHEYPQPDASLAALFNYQPDDPQPEVVVMPIVRSAVECVIGPPNARSGPIVMNVANSATGSIEAQGRNTFLVTCSPAAAEEITTRLRDAAAPPFTIRYRLTEQFDTGPATWRADLTVNVEAIYDALSTTAPAGPLTGDTAERIYTMAVASGAIRITSPDGELTRWLVDTDTVKSSSFGMLKDQLFDVGAAAATAGGPAPSWWNSVFGGAAVTLKTDHFQTGLVLTQTVELHGPVLAEQVVEGALDDLTIAAKADLDRYLTVLSVGSF